MGKLIKLIAFTGLVLAAFSGILANISPAARVRASFQGTVPVCDHWQPINITASTQIVTAGAGQFVYVCSVNLVAGALDNVALVEGTGATCGTNTAGMAGGATAATGWNFAANGGLSHGTGYGAIMRTATAGDNVCLLVSAASQLSGAVSWTSAGF